MIAFMLTPAGKAVSTLAIVILFVVGFRLWLSAHDKAVLSGYVSIVEKTAADAKASEAKRQMEIAVSATQKANDRASAAKQEATKIEAELERELADYEKRLADAKRSCLFDDSDVDAIMRHR